MTAAMVPADKGEGAWSRARTASTLLSSPNFYLHCPSRTDPSAAAPGFLSVMVLLPVANMQERGNNAGKPLCSEFHQR